MNRALESQANMETTEPLLSPELLARLERMELVSRKIFRGRLKGERRSPRKGQSVEFADYRNYVQGDDLRFIDWNTYARLDRLFLKLFLEEEDLHVHLIVDNSQSMAFGEPKKLRYAKQVAAALGFVGLVRSDRVSIHAIGGGGTAPAYRGRQQWWRMAEQLDQIQPAGAASLTEGIRIFCLRSTGHGVAVLISDLLDKQGFEQPLRMLAGRRMDTYVIQTLSAEELEPPVRGDLQLVDCEDGDRADVTINPALLKRYKATLEQFIASIKTFCARRGMVYVLAANQVPVEKLVVTYLRQRGLVR